MYLPEITLTTELKGIILPFDFSNANPALICKSQILFD